MKGSGSKVISGKINISKPSATSSIAPNCKAGFLEQKVGIGA